MKSTIVRGIRRFWAERLIVLTIAALLPACAEGPPREKGFLVQDHGERSDGAETPAPPWMEESDFTPPDSDAEWKKLLTPKQYRITRKKETEGAFTGAYWDSKEPGTYHCVCCGQPLFSSGAKYDSGSGWPSYFEPIGKENVRLQEDFGLGMRRFEALCGRCGAHLGHLFDDGPKPTGLRYCINSTSLALIGKKSGK